MKLEGHATIASLLANDDCNRDHAAQNRLEVRSKIGVGGATLLPHVFKDGLIGKVRRKAVDASARIRIRNPLDIEGPDFRRDKLEHGLLDLDDKGIIITAVEAS
jgi:hypothetical protein